MITSLLCAFALALSSVLASPVTQSSATCTTTTSTQKFETLPTGKIDPHSAIGELHYHGWEVVKKEDTPFTSWKSNKMLRTTGTTAWIQLPDRLNGSYFFNDYSDTTPSFYFGSTNFSHPAGGILQKTYENTRSDNIYYGYFNYTKYPHSLEGGYGGSDISTNRIDWAVQAPAGVAISPHLHLYIDEYRYILSNCKFLPGS